MINENNFEKLIEYYEKMNPNKDFIEINGKIPIILTAPHTMAQLKEDGSYKLNEPYTKAITLYLAHQLKTYAIVKIRDTGIDSNKDKSEYLKNDLVNKIKKNKLVLAIDIHGASSKRDFDVELGNLNNLSTDFSTIRELKEAFIENGVNNISINDPFKGGGITKSVYQNTNIDAVQIEINQKYRDITKISNIESICKALEQFIIQYYNVWKN
jgi:hypothetical protein